MASETDLTTCYRHPDRRAGVSCQRCDRPICPQCMLGASVGFHCPECARRGRQRVYTARSLVQRPWVTQLLMAVNAIVWFAGMADQAGGDDLVTGRGGLVVDGGLRAFDVAAGEWYRIFTSGFLHAGLLHLGFNVYALYLLGSGVENALGRVRFALLYLVALLGGAFGVLLLSPDSLTVGASGAVFGLLGAAIVGQRAAGINPRDSGLVGLLAVNLLFTFAVPGISIGGHLGGLAAGFIGGWLFFDVGPRQRERWLAPAVMVVLAIALFVGAIYVADNPLT
jgi:membrane associated rhomboid family serine protease